VHGPNRPYNTTAKYRLTTRPSECHPATSQGVHADLSERIRRWLITAAVANDACQVAAPIDITHRLASQIRDRKRMCAAAVALVSSAGVVPISYVVSGRRRQSFSTPRAHKRKVCWYL
jgi:hypothetical protein